tara:strand:- start:7 stop:237 length:231 start_codon:yes stop_codon:yes gene_type:complete
MSNSLEVIQRLDPSYSSKVDQRTLPPRARWEIMAGGELMVQIIEPNDGWLNVLDDTRRGRRCARFREKKQQEHLSL